MTDLRDKIIKKIAGCSLEGTLLLRIDNLLEITFDSTGNPVDIKEEYDCAVHLSQETLENIISGETDPMSAYFSGDLTIEKDLSIAMNLAKVLKDS